MLRLHKRNFVVEVSEPRQFPLVDGDGDYQMADKMAEQTKTELYSWFLTAFALLVIGHCDCFAWFLQHSNENRSETEWYKVTQVLQST